MNNQLLKRKSPLQLFYKAIIGAILILMLAACGTSTQKTTSSQLDKVKIGHVGSVSDAGIYIALEKGYFKEQGIELELTSFDSGGQMIAPLASGQIDVAGGAVSAGLFNAINSDIGVRIVADKGSTFKGFGYEGIMVANSQVDKMQQPKDFKGKKVGLLSVSGTSPESALNKWLQQDGLSTKDVNLVEVPLSNMGVALSTGAVDGVVIVEPTMTVAQEEGFGQVLVRDDEIWPGHTLGVLMYSEVFAEKSDVAERFMIAYIQGLRDFDEAFAKKDENKRDEVIDILTTHGKLDDRSMYDKMVMAGLDPNGEVNLKGMEEDQKYFLETGKQKESLDLNKVVDTQFVEKALEELGRK